MSNSVESLNIPGLGQSWAKEVLENIHNQFSTHTGSKRALRCIDQVLGMLDNRLIPQPSFTQVYPKGHIDLVWERSFHRFHLIVQPDHSCFCQLEENDKIVGQGEISLKFKETRPQNLLEILKIALSFMQTALNKEYAEDEKKKKSASPSTT